jgi:hypothetical protein
LIHGPQVDGKTTVFNLLRVIRKAMATSLSWSSTRGDSRTSRMGQTSNDEQKMIAKPTACFGRPSER